MTDTSIVVASKDAGKLVLVGVDPFDGRKPTGGGPGTLT